LRYIITFISIICSFNCFSQTPNPDLYQTWYLYDYYSTDDNIHHPVSEIAPSISPYITLSGNSNFNGVGACNSFFGTFSIISDNDIQFSNYTKTLLICNSSNHMAFESDYFSFIQTAGQYYLSGQGNNIYLKLTNPIFLNYDFRNTPLGSEDYDIKEIIIYPNPFNSSLLIDSQGIIIDKIEIYNSIGQSVKIINSNFDVINLSDIPSGIYIMKLYSEDKTVSKKIIKK
jgi:Secretion system C-terminal sorting domain/META domain